MVNDDDDDDIQNENKKRQKTSSDLARAGLAGRPREIERGRKKSMQNVHKNYFKGKITFVFGYNRPTDHTTAVGRSEGGLII